MNEIKTELEAIDGTAMAVVELGDKFMRIVDAETKDGVTRTINVTPSEGCTIATVMVQRIEDRVATMVLDPETNKMVKHHLVSGYSFLGDLPEVVDTPEDTIRILNEFVGKELFKAAAIKATQEPAVEEQVEFARVNSRVADRKPAVAVAAVDTTATVTAINEQLEALGLEVLFDAEGRPKVIKTDRYVAPARNGIKKYMPFL